MPANRTLRTHGLTAAWLATLLVAGCALDGEGTSRAAGPSDQIGHPVDPATSSASDDDASSAPEGSGPAQPGVPGGGGTPTAPTTPGTPAQPAPGGADAGQTSASDSGSAADARPNAVDAGAPIVDASAPEPSGRRCGTRGGISCGDGQFCNFEPDVDCGGTDRGGVCETKPQICSAIYAPVCGCDDRTYASACDAHGAGISVKHDGACTPAECTAAGGTVKASKGADIPKCGPGEDQWSLSGGIEPIICCKKRDGGTKPPPGKMCGGFAGLACEGKQFCNYEPAAGGDGCEDIADGAGVCEALPTGCTKEYAPVCGCDDRTYGNACMAHLAGISVKREGPCAAGDCKSRVCTEIDCKSLGGRPVDGLGPPPKCGPNEVDLGNVRYSSGQIAIEGTICCAPR